jgi:hypothetical protein
MGASGSTGAMASGGAGGSMDVQSIIDACKASPSSLVTDVMGQNSSGGSSGATSK